MSYEEREAVLRPTNQAWKCPNCGTELLTVEIIEEHKKRCNGGEYCKICKKVTPHKITGRGSGNTELECNICGQPKFLIQGFDSDLM